MKTLMILGGSILQLPAINKALEMGLTVVVVDMNPNAVGFTIPGVVKEVISTIDTPKVLEAAKKHRIDGIMTLASDMPMQTVATVAKELNLNGISEKAALRATNKAFMRESLESSGVAIPIYFVVNSNEQFKKAVNDIHAKGYKCIVKPADSSGSRGVSLLNDNSNLDLAYDYASKFSHDGRIMVEEYMEGPEVSVETFAVDGTIHVIQITDKITTGNPFFVEMGHSQPSLLNAEIQEKIMATAIAANKAIGISNGPSHTEIKVTKTGPKIVEIGARLGGDCITTHLVPLSTGINLVECCINMALGQEPDITEKWNKGSAIRFIKANEGILKSVEGIVEVQNLHGIEQVSLSKKIGESITEIRNSTDRVGFVIARAETVHKAIEIADRGVKEINLIVEKE